MSALHTSRGPLFLDTRAHRTGPLAPPACVTSADGYATYLLRAYRHCTNPDGDREINHGPAQALAAALEQARDGGIVVAFGPFAQACAKVLETLDPNIAVEIIGDTDEHGRH